MGGGGGGSPPHFCFFQLESDSKIKSGKINLTLAHVTSCFMGGGGGGGGECGPQQ